MPRFTGTCEELCGVNAAPLIEWLAAIPFEEWPQQKPPGVVPLKPAMQSNATWHDFGETFDPLVGALLKLFPGCIAQQRMLSAVMPGECIPPHVDHQCPEWICRAHVPLLTNKRSAFIMDDGAHYMDAGTAYKINTEARHCVINLGDMPRVHFMFDVRTA